MPTFFFVFGVALLVIGVTGMSFIRRERCYRRERLDMDEFLGYAETMQPRRSRERLIEASSRWLTVFGLLMAIVAYLRINF